MTNYSHKKNKHRKKRDWPFGGGCNPVHGEMSLWSAVITQAMMDALSKARSSEALYHKQNAIRWLTGNSDDFITVCLLAGYDPDYVRKKAKQIIANPVPWRAEAGKGKRYLERREYRKRSRKPKHENTAPSPSPDEQDGVITVQKKEE